MYVHACVVSVCLCVHACVVSVRVCRVCMCVCVRACACVVRVRVCECVCVQDQFTSFSMLSIIAVPSLLYLITSPPLCMSVPYPVGV